MIYDFDRVIDRRNTASLKWDQLKEFFGSEDVLPLWVADMDFPCPEPVKEALVRRAESGLYGYTIRTGEWFEAIQGWYRRRHGWDIAKEAILSSPGVVTSLSLAVELFSEPGAGVILQPPVYHPFYDVIRLNGRQVLRNPLRIGENGLYEMDFDGLERLMRDGAKLMLLCNPHNPGGRVWTRDELARVAELAAHYGVTVVSDEIHCDLVLPPRRHVPFAVAAADSGAPHVSLHAPTKTFNLPGVQSSFIAAGDPAIRRRLNERIRALSLQMQNYFALYATIAAFNEGDEWLDQLLAYVKAHIDFAIRYLSENAPFLRPMPPEGTYLLWVDCRALGLDPQGMKRLMFEEAKVAFNEGSMFGEEGAGFVRINCACPRSILEEALRRFAGAAARAAQPNMR